jgi:hypothetical protein
MAQRGRKKNEATKPVTANATIKTFENIKTDDKNNDGLVELNHWVNNGSLSVDGEEYKIVGGKVKVKPEHVKKALKHINMRW